MQKRIDVHCVDIPNGGEAIMRAPYGSRVVDIITAPQKSGVLSVNSGVVPLGLVIEYPVERTSFVPETPPSNTSKALRTSTIYVSLVYVGNMVDDQWRYIKAWIDARGNPSAIYVKECD